MNAQRPLPLPFPDPAQDFSCLTVHDPTQLNSVIRDTVAKRMVRVWDYAVHHVYSHIPGFGKESRASGVYWRVYPNPLFVIVFAEFLPTRRFHALAGAPIPTSGQVRSESCLILRLSLSLHPPMAELPEPASLRLGMYVERAQPVKSLLTLWNQTRDEFAQLIHVAHLEVCFGDLMKAQPEPYALDRYRLARSRKHGVSFGRELICINSASEITTPILALAKVYHAVQGNIRGDATRLNVLRSS
jgi:hypothetical protein